MDHEYVYEANVVFVFDHMTITHWAYFCSDEFYEFDSDIIEDNIISHAERVIEEHYGISLRSFRPIDIVVEWKDYPTEEHKDNSINEEGT